MRILILGGSGFIGAHMIRYAVARGHAVTNFSRGTAVAGVEQRTGDRDGNLEVLKSGEWDAVIDIPAKLPQWVRDAANVLRDRASHYVYISTISVYSDRSKPADESSPLREDESYGGLKALAEREAEKAFPGRTTIVRSGLIVGPGDHTDRFTYWPVRIARGGEVLAPGHPTDRVQFIDVRDLAEWVVRLVEEKIFGVFNALGPAHPLTIAEMLYGIKAVTTAGAQFTWVPAAFLEAQNVAPWSDMPAWLPPDDDHAGVGRTSNARALAAGLTFRSLADTAAATLAWSAAASGAALKAGITPEREAEVLAAWRKQQ